MKEVINLNTISVFEKLKQLYPDRIVSPKNINDIPKDGYVVYILAFDNTPIVLGHGKKNRAKVIFDDEKQITLGHLKAFFVRLYNLFGNGSFERIIIPAQSKEDAKHVESDLHRMIGGNNRCIPDQIKNELFKGFDKDSITYLVLEIALRSSFDGLADIKKWKNDGIISNKVWKEISERLRLT